MSKIYFELNELDKADYYSNECLRISKLMGNWTMFFHAITKLQIIKQTKGDVTSAKRLMKEDEEAMNNQTFTHFRELLIYTQRATAQLMQRNFKAVSNWREKYQADPTKNVPYHINGKLLEARFLIATEKYDEASNILKRGY